MSKEIQWEDAPEAAWEDAPEGSKAGRLLDKAFHSAMGVTGPLSETAANFVSGIPAALSGGLTYLGTLAGSQDPDAALHVKQKTEEAINKKVQYDPKTHFGKTGVEELNKGMQKIVETGGDTFGHTVGAIPFVGKDLADNPEAMKAMGKAYTEMMLNVAPIEGIAGMRRGAAKGEVVDHASKLEGQVEPKWEDAPETKQNGATDPGVPPTEGQPQGQLFGQEAPPTAPIPETAQQGLFDKPVTVDHGIPYEPLSLGGEPPAPKAELQMPMVPDRLELVPKDEAPTPPEEFQPPNIGSRDAAAAKLRDQAHEEMANLAQERAKNWQKEEAYAGLDSAKERDLNHMEAQKELDFADSTAKIENSTTRSFFLDPKNMDKVDFHGDHEFAGEALGDKSLMNHAATGAMVEALHRGDVNAALDVISKGHDNVAYRNLAEYLKGKLEGLNIKMHDEGVLEFGDRQATGYYDPESHTVGFSKVGAVSPHTVLHELVHSITSDFINSRPNDLRVMGLKDLYTKLNDLGMQKAFPNIVNIKEFLAEAFSNHEFQQFLKEHRLVNRSTWGRFVDNVKSILGISTGHLADALEHALDLGKQVMEASESKNGLNQFKDAGVPSKLADLMVTRNKRPEPMNTKNFEDVQRLKVPGLTGPISDFTFFDKPISEIIEMARTAEDIPNTVLEKLSHQLQGGGLFESLKTRNPVVKQTYERITRASQEAARLIKENLTHPETGLVPRMRAMTPTEKGEIHAVMMLHEGERVLSAQELRQKYGMNEKQVAYAAKYRELNDSFFNDINDARKQVGLAPMDKRIAHIAGRFMGDFSRFVFGPEKDARGNIIKGKDGKPQMTKIVGRIAGSTRWELNRISKHIAENNPNFVLGKREYNTLGQGKRPGDRFSGLMEALNFLTKTDADVASLMESYRGYMQRDAVNYLNATRHAKAKVHEAGGIIGSEGNKPWETVEKNAEDGMKAQLSYFEQGYSWIAMEKAVNDLKPLLGNEDVIHQNKNAVQWSQQYLDHALGRNQGKLADAANWTASKIGELSTIGHSNLFKASNVVKHLAMQKFMGLLNIPFSITQMMQPLQVHPAMVTLLKNRGLEFSARDAQAKAAHTFLKTLTDHAGPINAFEKSALDYAEKMGIMDVKMADHTKDINASPIKETYDKIADLNITIPERLTRGNSFLFYAHLLNEAGIPAKDIFGAAENMTNMTMVNYHPIERPMGYAKLGWLGDIASTLTRYKHNQASQMAFYTREGIMSGQGVKGYTPMAAFLATSLAFGGVMGFFGYQEADAAYQYVTNHLGKPDTLSNVITSSGMPEVISHGVFSTLGLDMTTRFSNANMIPNSIPEALMPYGSAVLDLAKSTGRFISNPGMTTGKQLLKSAAPQSVQGILENQLFTEKQKDGRNLYINNTDGPNMGKGRVYRDEGEMMQRNFGFRSIRESKELSKNYSDGQIDKAHKDIVDGILTKAKYAAMDGTLDTAKLKQLANRAVKYGETPDSFISKITQWSEARHLSQAQQRQLQNALGGFRGAMNLKEGR